MASPAAFDFVHLLAAALLDSDGEVDAERLHASLGAVLAEQRSMVLEVQFTGFTEKGALVGGVDPLLLRAAAHLITLRLNRLGFTADAGPEDLAAFVRAAGAAADGSAGDGVLAAVAAAAPMGVYVGSTTGQGYKPRPASAGGDVAPAPGPTAAPAEPREDTAGDAPNPDATDLAAFEILDPVEVLAEEPPRPAARVGAAAGLGGAERAPEPPSDDMYHFFRSASGAEAGAEHLPRLLAEAESANRFDELADSAARQAAAMLLADAHAPAVALLSALIREGERPDRTRVFRESAVQALRRAAAPETLHRLIERLPYAGGDRTGILRVFAFLGPDALLLLEPLLHRSDGELRREVFDALVSAPGVAARLAAHALADPAPARARTLLELARDGGADAALRSRWAAELGTHPDPVVRVEAARTASSVGGREALRLLLGLLADPEGVVRREAVQGLGRSGEPAAVPFLARLLTEHDEEMQCAAAAALGRLGSPEALAPLLSLVQKRSLLSLRRHPRARMAAVQAIGRIDTPAARDALRTVASERNDLADEARRILGDG